MDGQRSSGADVRSGRIKWNLERDAKAYRHFSRLPCTTPTIRLKGNSGAPCDRHGDGLALPQHPGAACTEDAGTSAMLQAFSSSPVLLFKCCVLAPLVRVLTVHRRV